MSYTEEILYLRKKIPNYPNESTKWLFNKMRSGGGKFAKTSLGSLMSGKFFFMRYDMQKLNKSSKLEQFVPMMIVDYKPAIDKKVIWVLNMNFMPRNIKEAFFSDFLSRYKTTLENNYESKTLSKEEPLSNIDYKNMWGALIPYGFEYAIREIRVDLINDLYAISTDDLQYLTTLNTQILTGVDDAKLNEIWVTKLKNESIGDRVEDLKTIKANYQNILTELADKFKSLNNNLKGI